MTYIQKGVVEVSTTVLVVSNATVDETYAVPSTPKPGESLIACFQSRDVGGKGANVACVLSRAGVDTMLMAGVGFDERGEYIRQTLVNEPLVLDLVANELQPSDISLICTDQNGENSIVTTVAAAQGLPSSRAVLALQGMSASGWLVLQGNLTAAMTAELMDEARRCGHRIAFNPSPLADWMMALTGRADVLVLNEGEAGDLTGHADELAVRALLHGDTVQVALTRGARGAILGTRAISEEDSSAQLIVGQAVEAGVVDTTGAGDTWLATALASAIRRNTWLDALALRHAAEAAAITIGRYGTRKAFPDTASLDDILGQA